MRAGPLRKDPGSWAQGEGSLPETGSFQALLRCWRCSSPVSCAKLSAAVETAQVQQRLSLLRLQRQRFSLGALNETSQKAPNSWPQPFPLLRSPPQTLFRPRIISVCCPFSELGLLPPAA